MFARALQRVAESQPKTDVGKALKAKLEGLIKSSFGNLEEIKLFAGSTLLDPRYKKVGFTEDLRKPIRIANAQHFVGELTEHLLLNSSKL